MLTDRSVPVDHTTLYHWIQAYASELNTRLHRNPLMTSGSRQVDETSVRVKGRWMYGTAPSMRADRPSTFGSSFLENGAAEGAEQA